MLLLGALALSMRCKLLLKSRESVIRWTTPSIKTAATKSRADQFPRFSRISKTHAVSASNRRWGIAKFKHGGCRVGEWMAVVESQ
jgi:hypothetical protein